MDSREVKLLTLCLYQKEGRVLLGMKKRGFGEGRLNGFGGKVEPNENIIDAAKREMREESGLTPTQLEEVGVINFEFVSQPDKVREMHIFRVDSIEDGEPIETEEMKPIWFKSDELPYNKMWNADAKWMSLFLSGGKFTGRFLYDTPGDNNILKFELKETTPGLIP